MKKRRKMHPALVTLIVIVSIIATLVFGIVVALLASPRARYLGAITRFAVQTLSNSNYIGYDLDVMELCRDYIDSDVEYEGDVIVSDIYGFNYTSSAKVHGYRSFDMRQLSCQADAKVLFADVGECDAYIQDKTIYYIVPSLHNMAYALTTNTDFFWQAPRLTDNLDLQWFKEHASDIIDFSGEITIDETGQSIVDEDGTLSYEYKILVPQGSGDFIWELMGMDMPNHDITLYMYITRGCLIRRIYMDVGNVIENAEVTVDGVDLGTVILHKTLPDNEDVTFTFSRIGNYRYSNYINMAMNYNSKDGSKYWGNGVLIYQKTADGSGYNLEIKRLTLNKGDKLLGQMYFNGNVHPTKCTNEPVFSATIPFASIKNYSWEEIRDNIDEFLDEVKTDVRDKI